MTTRWGILATGRIARKLADAVVESDTSELVAVGSRTQAAADAFRQGLRRHLRPRHLRRAAPGRRRGRRLRLHAASAARGMDDPGARSRQRRSSARSPWASTTAEVMAMVETAVFHDRFLMEAFMYRTHPQTAKIVELVRRRCNRRSPPDQREPRLRLALQPGKPLAQQRPWRVAASWTWDATRCRWRA